MLQVAAGGAFGASLRYAFLLLSPPVEGAFPWTIFAENIVGSFLLGLFLTLILDVRSRFRRYRPLVATGVLGSLTTFSTFVWDFLSLLILSEVVTAITYLSVAAVAGLLAAWAGISSGRVLRERLS
jgi:fluoride exporter